MSEPAIYARLQHKNNKWLKTLAEKSGWSLKEVLERLCEFGRDNGFIVEKKPIPDYLKNAVKRYKAIG